MKKNLLILLFGLLILAGLAFIPRNSNNQNNHPLEAGITDFLSCADAGFPVTESFPAQCRTPSGKVFTEDISEYSEVLVDSPAFGELVESPMQVKGKARGSWFFEASMPVVLQDESGNAIAQGYVTAQGDWMTEDYVNFSGELTFTAPQTQYGVLVVAKDNPSGLQENDASYAVPVRFR
jgi:hypothetical protein